MLVSLTELREREPFEVAFTLTADDANALLDVAGIRLHGDSDIAVNLVRFPDSVKVTTMCEFKVALECGRCLEAQLVSFNESSEFVLMSEKQFRQVSADEEIELSADDLDVVFYDGIEIDTMPLVREALLDPLPTHFVCGSERRVQCDEAYASFIGEEAEKANEETKIDLRWAPLLALKNKED